MKLIIDGRIEKSYIVNILKEIYIEYELIKENWNNEIVEFKVNCK